MLYTNTKIESTLFHDLIGQPLQPIHVDKKKNIQQCSVVQMSQLYMLRNIHFVAMYIVVVTLSIFREYILCLVYTIYIPVYRLSSFTCIRNVRLSLGCLSYIMRLVNIDFSTLFFHSAYT